MDLPPPELASLPVEKDVSDPNAVAAEPQASSGPASASSCVLRLRGLPFSAVEEDIRDFFKAFSVQSVFICKRNGRATGEAYVQLDSPSSATQALEELNRQHMGHRYIEVFDSSEADMSTAKAMSVDRLKGYVVRARGLPYSASASDVLRFFAGLDVVRGMEGIVFTYTPDGRPTGEAYVEFQDEEGQKEAMKKHKESIGARYIELFISTKADMLQAIQHNRMILGYANRKRWLTQGTGMPGQLIYGSGMPGSSGSGMPGSGGPGGGGSNAGMMGQRGMHHGYGTPNVEDVAELFSGFSMGGLQQQQQRMGNGSVPMPYGQQFDLQQADQRMGGGRGRGSGGGSRYGGPGLHDVSGRGGRHGPHHHVQHQLQQQQQQQQAHQQSLSYGQAALQQQAAQVQQAQSQPYLLPQQQQQLQYDPSAYLTAGMNGDASQQQQAAYFAAAAAAAAAGNNNRYYGASSGGGGGNAHTGQYYGQQGGSGATGGGGGGGNNYVSPGTYTITAIQVPTARGLEYQHLPGGLQTLELSQPMVGGGGLQRFEVTEGGELHSVTGNGPDASQLDYTQVAP